MNERIKELAVDCAGQMEWDAPKNPEYFTFNRDELQKFAELIIKDQQREWIVLTDAEILQFWHGDHGMPGGRCANVVELARFVEAKLKEKNT